MRCLKCWGFKPCACDMDRDTGEFLTARCKICNEPDPSGHAARGMRCPKCWKPIPTLDEKRLNHNPETN